MQTWIKKLILCSVFCILCSVSQAANDFSADASCVALWRFENGALTADSKGTNTLTASATPVADTVTYKEGAASCDFELSESDYFSIADASLNAGYPLKNGDATKNISICGWIKIESLPSVSGYRIFYHKGAANKYSFLFSVYNDAGTSKVRMSVGYNSGNSWENIDFGTGVTTGIWYHVAMTYQNSDKSYRIRIWDDNAGALLGVDKTGNSTNAINVEDGQVEIGSFIAGYFWDGLIDELIVFNDILISDEIDQIRGGTYGAAPAAGGQVIIVEME